MQIFSSVEYGGQCAATDTEAASAAHRGLRAGRIRTGEVAQARQKALIHASGAPGQMTDRFAP